MKEYLTQEEAQDAARRLALLDHALNQVLFGQTALIRNVIYCVLARGHALLEGLPGLGKTELVKGLARAIALDSKRIQFTPDLLPGDITGNPVMQEVGGERKFAFQPGPLFTNIVLADEINRASPKTQSALLEAMQERRVTVMGETRMLPAPFFVLATQNPIELEGTYPLPEAQLDRFLFKLDVHRTDPETLVKIVQHREMGVDFQIDPVISQEELHLLMERCRRVYLPDVVAEFIARLVDGTHPGKSSAADSVKFGASPRAALGLAAAAKARALFNGRINASFEDVQAIAPCVLAHRLVLEYSARLEGRSAASVVSALLAEIPYQQRAVPDTLQSIAPN